MTSIVDLLDRNDLTGAYPEAWDEFVGQDRTKRQLQVAAKSAKMRAQPLPHVMLAAGEPGVGKTSLALLAAAEAGGNLKVATGKVDANAARILLADMHDRDVLFLDEIHQLVQGGKANAEWLLHFLTDGIILGPRGPEPQPKVTIIGATTDVGRLPDTVVSRFALRPIIEPYTIHEAQIIAAKIATKMMMPPMPFPSARDFLAIAKAANNNPRMIHAIVSNLRDLALAAAEDVWDGAQYDLTEPLEWLGLSPDGLTATCRRYLVLLLDEFGGQAGEKTLRDRLQEPGGLVATERILSQKGLIGFTSKGRTLTSDGIKRAKEEMRDG